MHPFRLMDWITRFALISILLAPATASAGHFPRSCEAVFEQTDQAFDRLPDIFWKLYENAENSEPPMTPQMLRFEPRSVLGINTKSSAFVTVYRGISVKNEEDVDLNFNMGTEETAYGKDFVTSDRVGAVWRAEDIVGGGFIITYRIPALLLTPATISPTVATIHRARLKEFALSTPAFFVTQIERVPKNFSSFQQTENVLRNKVFTAISERARLRIVDRALGHH